METFERDWEPLEADPTLTPVKLIIILDLYFQLTPITMVAETPEIIDLAKLIHTTPEKIADVMSIYMFCDPYLNREDVLISPLLNDCSATSAMVVPLTAAMSVPRLPCPSLLERNVKRSLCRLTFPS